MEYFKQVIRAKITTNLFHSKQMEAKANVSPTRRDFTRIEDFALLNQCIETPAKFNCALFTFFPNVLRLVSSVYREMFKLNEFDLLLNPWWAL